MTAKASAPHVQRADLILALREFIDALDRRVPHIERAGEVSIARDALELRRQALERLHELEAADAN
jgi:hypothetical protein